MKILIIIGTRPEAIKMAPLIMSFRKNLNVKICVTGQHKEMLDQVLELFQLTPDYNLNLMKPNQNLSNLTGKILNGVSPILYQEKFRLGFGTGRHDIHNGWSNGRFLSESTCWACGGGFAHL